MREDNMIDYASDTVVPGGDDLEPDAPVSRKPVRVAPKPFFGQG